MTDQKRAKNVAVLGTVLQLVFLAVLLAVWNMTNAHSPLPVLLFLAGGVFLWLMVAVWFYCRQLARQEEHELAELAAANARSTTIFEPGQDAEARPAAHRLAAFEKWVNPIFTLLWAAFHLVIGALMLRAASRGQAIVPNYAREAAIFSLIVAFVAFLLSRYATGMASRPQWRPLRPAGSYLLMGMLLTTAMMLAMLAALQGWPRVDLAVAYVVPLVQLILAAELLVNFVLDLYRPHVTDQEARVSYDSRLLGLIAEPQRVGHSIAETLNYQFGFEVSKTWFYRLVARAFVPMILFGAAALLALSCLVYVAPGTECVVRRWGRVDTARATLKPGLGFKLPWPVETVETFNVGRIYSLSLGLYPKGAKVMGPTGELLHESSEDPLQPGQKRTKLWKTAHGYEGRLEKDFIVPAYLSGSAGQTSPMGLVKLVVQVRYRIKDIYRFGFEVADAHKVLESLANRELVRYCSRVPMLDEFGFTGGGEDPTAPSPNAAAPAAHPAAGVLKDNIQRAVDDPRVNLGVQIVEVGLLGIHPPETAADAYEAVLGAWSERETLRSQGRAQADRELSAAGGNPQGTQLLALSIRKVDQLGQLRQARDTPAFEALVKAFDKEAADRITLIEMKKSQAVLRGRTDETASAEELRQANAAWQGQLNKLLADRKAGVSVDLAGAVQAAEAQTERLLGDAAGDTAARIAQARAFRWKKEIEEGSLAKEFVRESLPYRNEATRQVYLADRLYGTWEKVLPRAVKYVMAVDPKRVKSWLNYERPERGAGGPNFGPADSPRK